MLSSLGKNNPIVVVFTSSCCGILLFFKDLSATAFCLLMLIFMMSRYRVIHMVLGFILGFASAYLAPTWVDIKEGEHVVYGTVASAQYAEGTYSVVLKKVALDGKKLRGNFQLNVYRDVVDLGEGSILMAKARTRSKLGLGNKDEFDYKRFLLSRNIVQKGSVASPDKIKIVNFKKPSGLKHEINTALSRLANPRSEILKAMLTGDTSGITDNIQDSFNSIGISHLIAISGLNMSIIIFICYTLIFAVFRIIPPISLRTDAPFVAKTGAIIGVVIYTMFVGPNIPTLRASIMACCILISFSVQRKTHILDSLSLAGIVMLIIWPYSIFTASFLLTFSAVLGIVGTIQICSELPEWILLLIIPVVVSAFTMPIIIYQFGFISYTGILVNILVVPFFSVAIMPLGILGLLIYPTSQQIASFTFSMANDAIGFLISLSYKIGSMIAFPKPWILWVFFCYIGLIMAFFSEKQSLRNLLLSFFCLAIISLPLIQHYMTISRSMSFDFISVGQGDSTLITKGKNVVLIDVGSGLKGFDSGRHIVAPHLLRNGVSCLDLVIISHMHPDHSAGIPYILERFPVREIWMNYTHHNNPYYNEIYRVALNRNIPVKNVCRSEKLNLGDMSINVLSPCCDEIINKGKLDENMLSVVAIIGDSNLKGLFMGDAEMYGELILAHLEQNIRAHVLKVAHHGSKRSCLEPFLHKVRPKIAVISCGTNNIYGDPSPESLARLKKHDVAVYRTDLHGEVRITSLSPGIDIKSSYPVADNQ